MVEMSGDEQFTALEKLTRTMRHVHITDRTDDRITIQFKGTEGIGTVHRYALFPGIFLGFNDVETGLFPCFKGELVQGFKLNFCTDGRCEVKMSDGMYLFLETGDFSFSNLTVSDNFSLPYQRYHGIELHIYDSALKEELPPLFKHVGIDLTYLCKKFCPVSRNFIAKASEETKSVFLAMTDTIPEGKQDYLRLKVTELLFLLMHIEIPTEKVKRNFFTVGQVKIAKQVMKIITMDLGARYPIKKLAEQFSISPSSLNKYFYGVYGESIASYLRSKRMHKATEYLEKTRHQIADIALLTGYENASKFAAVFKAAKGESPLEYRRRHRAFF
jgi:AraC-like DNA-binding protein